MSLGWLEQSEQDVPPGRVWLSQKETRVFGGLRFAKRRADWLLGRWTAKCAVVARLDGPRWLSEIDIIAAPSGAPEVFCCGLPAHLAISISHRAGVACCAVASSSVELGCDLEVIEPRSTAFVEDYFAPSEQRLVSDAPVADHSLLTALVWSAKESALKLLRAGLRADTRSVIVVDCGDRTDDSGNWQALLVRHEGSEYHGWWRRSGTLVRTVVAAPRQPMPQEVTPAFGELRSCAEVGARETRS